MHQLSKLEILVHLDQIHCFARCDRMDESLSSQLYPTRVRIALHVLLMMTGMHATCVPCVNHGKPDFMAPFQLFSAHDCC